MKVDLQILKSITILYVEDSIMMREQTLKMFNNIFKKVYCGEDGKEGLELFKEHQQDIDAVVSDLSMPYMDGLELTKRIRELNPSIPIIITTAHSDQENTMKALNIGVSKYITKPLKIGELSELIALESKKYRKSENINKMTHQLVRDHKAIKEQTNELQGDYDNIKNELGMKSFLIDNYLFQIVTNKHAKIQSVTNRILTFFGYTKDELIGEEISILQCDLSSFATLQKSLLDATRTKKRGSRSFYYADKIGKKYEFTITIVPSYSDDQMVNGYTYYLNINP